MILLLNLIRYLQNKKSKGYFLVYGKVNHESYKKEDSNRGFKSHLLLYSTENLFWLVKGILNINFITLCFVEDNNMFNFKGSEMDILHFYHPISTLYRQKFCSSLCQLNDIRKEII
jgi:hypothetical protein